MRYLPDESRYQRMTTDELREHFLVSSLFEPGEIRLETTALDRAIVGGAVPTDGPLALEATEELAADTFTDRREVGILNVGGRGTIEVDGERFAMANRDCLYVGRGSHEIFLSSDDASSPARFYLISYPAHESFPTEQVSKDDADVTEIGSDEGASRRLLYKYVHPDGIRSSQLVMGITEIQPGSVWNTMPAHTHERRTEVYFYFDIPEGDAVFHLMGSPKEIRPLVVKDAEAVLSPGWSIHAGAGTKNYTFCWAMGGENQDFSDMQGVDIADLR